MYNTLYECKFCHQTFVGHYKRIVCDSPECKAKRKIELKNAANKVSRKARSKVKIKKKLNKPSTKCIRCGRSKGSNRWYCTSCLRYLTNLYGCIDNYEINIPAKQR